MMRRLDKKMLEWALSLSQTAKREREREREEEEGEKKKREREKKREQTRKCCSREAVSVFCKIRRIKQLF